MTATMPPPGSGAGTEDTSLVVEHDDRTRTIIALAAWVTLLLVGRVWGLAVVRDAPEPLYVDAVPFYGVWRAEITLRLALAVLVVGVVTVVLPRMADRLGWRSLLGAVAVGSVAVSLALAFVEPPADAWRNIHGDYGQYTHLVDEQGIGGFLRDYTTEQRDYPTHLSAHPPGMVLLLWTEGKLGLGNTVGEIATAMAGVAAAAVAALVALRELAGEERARRAAAFLVIAPAAVWHTNADVVFGGIALAGLALLTVATGHSASRATLPALGGGVLLGIAMLFSHGLVLMAVPALAVVVHRRGWREGALAVIGALAALAVPLLWGYSWLAGLDSTKVAYDRNLARVRPYGYFLLGNLAAFAVAVGPAVAVALARLRDRATWALVGGGLAAVVLADVSGLSLAETERIWQPFMPLVLLAGGAVVVGRAAHARSWLALQAVTTVALVAFLRSPW
ncbi:MAG TPA: hypothetical protein VIY72_03980 [Acidimicrobiales bacterium]